MKYKVIDMKYLDRILLVGLIVGTGLLMRWMGYHHGYKEGLDRGRHLGVMMREINMSHMLIERSDNFDTSFYHFGDSGKIISYGDSPYVEVFTK